jgi:hypothetical protein
MRGEESVDQEQFSQKRPLTTGVHRKSQIGTEVDKWDSLKATAQDEPSHLFKDLFLGLGR